MECRLWVSDDKASLLEKETGRTAMTDSRTSLSAINTIHIDLRALIYTLNVNIATLRPSGHLQHSSKQVLPDKTQLSSYL
jgi:hypothetical protein